MPRFTNFSVYGKDGRKQDYQTSANLSGESNAEPVIVDGDVPGYSEGVPTSAASIEYAICREGNDASQTMFDLWASKKTAVFTFGIIDGRILKATMLVKSFDYKSDPKSGTTGFTCSLIGGNVTKTG